MGRIKPTEAQQRYREFDRKSKVISALLLLVGLIVLIGFLICMWCVEDNLVPVLICLGALVLWFVVLCTTAGRLNSRRIILYEAAYGKETDVIPGGLFGELREEFEWNQFEGLTDGRVVFAEAHNNTIEMEILRKKHEFHITIDQNAVCMVMDDETDTPVEKEIPLAEMTGVGQVLTAIREFVENMPGAAG